MSFEEIANLTANIESSQHVRNFLSINNISTSTDINHNYIKASASIKVWENLFDTEFYIHEDRSASSGKIKYYNRAQEYSVPADIFEHVTAVFNTIQVPPSLHRRARMRGVSEDAPHPFKTNLRFGARPADTKTVRAEDTVTPVTVSFLNELYQIPSNIGNAAHKQAVFETASEYFSPDDLTLFQTHFHMEPQAAQDVGGYSTTQCSESGDPVDCYEGNLDIQYMMGVAQVS